LFDFKVGEGSVEFDTPINETVSAINDTVFMKTAERFNDGF